MRARPSRSPGQLEQHAAPILHVCRTHVPQQCTSLVNTCRGLQLAIQPGADRRTMFATEKRLQEQLRSDTKQKARRAVSRGNAPASQVCPCFEVWGRLGCKLAGFKPAAMGIESALQLVSALPCHAHRGGFAWEKACLCQHGAQRSDVAAQSSVSIVNAARNVPSGDWQADADQTKQQEVIMYSNTGPSSIQCGCTSLNQMP